MNRGTREDVEKENRKKKQESFTQIVFVIQSRSILHEFL